MRYQEKFDLTDENASYFASQFNILITGRREETDERHVYIRKNLSGFEGLIYSFDTCDKAEDFYFKIEDNKGTLIQECENKSLIPDLAKLLREKNFTGARICVDITTLKQGILFLLIKLLLKEIKPSLLFGGYTEPMEYRKRKQSELGEIEEFDLYEKVIGSSTGIPGFIKHQSNKPILLIATMGFDSQRLQTIYENLKPAKLIPIVGFPSFVPGWNITAINMNYMFLKQSMCSDMVASCESASPFALYEKLEELYHSNIGQFDIYICPLGTRPHCLGSALFATLFPSAYLIYDFPIEKKFRSEKILKANMYHLSKYIV